MTESRHRGRSVSLRWLLDGIAATPATAARVSDVTLDSREATPGSLFFALPGAHSHGSRFARQAHDRGAGVVLWEPGEGAAPPALPHSVFVAAVPGLSRLVGRICDRFFHWPSAQLRIFGITGTNGKTTCAYLLGQCLERLGVPAAYIGTLGWGRIGSLARPSHTTPDVVTLHRQLAELKARGVRDVAMEVSSHALDQDRIAAVRLHTAAFTNLSRDHLDYHGDMQAYGAAKARLFALPGLRQIVVNAGDPFGRELLRRADAAPATAVWIGEDDWPAAQTLQGAELRLDPHGMSMRLGGSFGAAALRCGLIGRFNAENAVVVLGCLASAGVPLADAVRVFAPCAAPPGRMEVVAPAAARPAAVIDYAHTPDALAKALSALREHCAGALWCVFGCGGDRDPGKRPLMGAIADALADHIIVTDDNPRTEDPAAITGAIVGAIHSHRVRVIHDRAAAIAAALGEAAAADLVLIAGKGHEDEQVYGDTPRPFSDRAEALRHLGAVA
jgi:UDP-N-acetylmuramoyl-L-alanyl-D-glutamate--2,6-diaminopimelate ligase